MKLYAAMSFAEMIQRELADYCIPGFCQIAGSIRRGRPEVRDIDLVMLPRPGMRDRIKDRCRKKSRIIADGRQNFHFALQIRANPKINHIENEFEVQIFFAHAGIEDLVEPRPTNFGTLLLCRTGSKEHNILLCRSAKRQGMKWDPYEGIRADGKWIEDEVIGQDYQGGKIIACETEEKVFQALGMKWVAPVYREVGSSMAAAQTEAQQLTTP